MGWISNIGIQSNCNIGSRVRRNCIFNHTLLGIWEKKRHLSKFSLVNYLIFALRNDCTSLVFGVADCDFGVYERAISNHMEFFDIWDVYQL
jgi:hypothetical protein